MSSQREEIREQLSAYLDGEVPEDRAQRLEQAISDDPALAAELEALRSVRNLLRGLPRAPAPAGLAERVMERAERARLLEAPARAGGRPAAWWLGRVAAAAVVMIAVAVGVLVVARLSTPVAPDRAETYLAMKDGPAKTDAAADGLRAAAGRRLSKGGRVPPTARPATPTELAVANSEIVETPQVHFFINTDNLVLAQRQMADELRRNDLVQVDGDRADQALAKVMVSRAKLSDQAQAGANRIDFDIVVDQTELRKIVAVVNAVRASQDVAQIPLRDGKLFEKELEQVGYLAKAGTPAARETAAVRPRGRTLGPPRQVGLAKPRPASPGEAQIAQEPGSGWAQQAGAGNGLAAAADKDWVDDFWNVRSALTTVPARGPRAIAKAPAPALAQPPAQVFNFQSKQIVRIIASQRGPGPQVALATRQAIQVAGNFRRLRVVLVGPAEPRPAARSPVAKE